MRADWLVVRRCRPCRKNAFDPDTTRMNLVARWDVLSLAGMTWWLNS